MIVYSMIAPGIAFGLTAPLTGSEIVVASFTTVSGTLTLLVHVQVTEAGGMVIVRLRPVPETVTVVPSLSRTHASDTVYAPAEPFV